MKIREIEEQLRTYLPMFVDYFSTWNPITSYTSVTNTTTIVGTTIHNLIVGDVVSFKDVLFPNPITSLTQVDGVGTLITTYPTDITHPYKETVTISGATETSYNGTFDIVSVINRSTITFTIDSGAPVTATGSPILTESGLARYNNLFNVVSVPTATSFTFTNVSEDFVSTGTPTFNIYKDNRIAGDITPERATASYSKQDDGDFWMFIVSEDSVASDSRAVNSDFVQEYVSGDFYRNLTQEKFALYVYVPAIAVITPVDAQDICRNELKMALIKTLAGFFPAKLFYNDYQGTYYISDEFHDYTTSYYVHKFTFAAQVTVALEDIFIPRSYAINDIHIDYVKESDTTNIIASDYIQLKT